MAIIMANPLTNPDRFFAGISGREPNLLVPFVIVLITAIIPAIAEVICYFHAAAAGIAVELVAPFIVWFLFAGAFYAISIFFGGVARSNECSSLQDMVSSRKSFPRSSMP